VASIWVTGSSAGIGLQTASTLFHSGHRVVLHARNEQRAEEVEQAVPGAAAVVIGDLASLEEPRHWRRPPRRKGPSTPSSTMPASVGLRVGTLQWTGSTRSFR
jgi:NAD(P)-dependent dehydrogenase (short-subunit alcohol dehydrogenase family)